MFWLCLVALFVWMLYPSYILRFVWFIFLDALYGVLVDLLVLDLRFLNRREKIYRNVVFYLKYMVHHIF
jgi:hypothetical protein